MTFYVIEFYGRIADMIFRAEGIYLILKGGRRKCRQWCGWVILLKSLLSAESTLYRYS